MCGKRPGAARTGPHADCLVLHYSDERCHHWGQLGGGGMGPCRGRACDFLGICEYFKIQVF